MSLACAPAAGRPGRTAWGSGPRSSRLKVNHYGGAHALAPVRSSPRRAFSARSSTRSSFSTRQTLETMGGRSGAPAAASLPHPFDRRAATPPLESGYETS
jgi:hypothetical protein